MIESATYSEWRSAIVDEIYCPDMANLPVYLDIEDEVLAACVARVEPAAKPAVAAGQESLVKAVKSTFDLGPSAVPSTVLQHHEVESSRWRRLRRSRTYTPETNPPPSLPFLAVMSRAAELMAADEAYAASNYYDRLVGLLSINPDQKELLRQGIARVSEQLWDDLNTWLDDLGGSRGLPTAEAIGHRFVGLPISQAMLRSADRAKFAEFFDDAGFAPGQSISLPDIGAYIDQWLVHGTIGPQSGLASLKAIWRKSAGKDILSQALSTALALWDGALGDEVASTSKTRGVLLTARVARQGAFSPVRLNLSVAIRGRLDGPRALPPEWEVASSTDRPPPQIAFRTEDDRYLVPNRRLEGVESRGLLEGRIVLRPALATGLEAPQHVVPLERPPRPVVVLVNMGSGTYVEVEHAQMGEEHIVLVNEAATNPAGKLWFAPGGVQDVGNHLSSIAQPGFVRLSAADLPGVPEGWSVFRRVLIIARLVTPAPALEPLVTSQTGTLSVVNGLRLPGLIRRWSAEAPLTISAAVPEVASLSLTLTCQESLADEQPPAPLSWTTEDGQLVAAITKPVRTPGSYRLELRSPATDSAVRQSFTFQQVTADHPRIGAVPSDEHPAHDLPREVSPGSAATPADNSISLPLAKKRLTIPQTPWWMTPKSDVKLVEAAKPEAGGCAITGAHRMHLKTNYGNRWDRGECQHCGMVKMYRSKPTKKKVAEAAEVTHAAVRSAADLPQFAASEINGVAALDALGWLGGGNAHELAHVLRQVAADSLGADELLRMLGSTGHVDVVRDEAMAVHSWVMAPRTLSQTRTGEWAIVGAWGQRTLRKLANALKEAHIPKWASDAEDFLPVRLITAPQDAIAPIAAGLGIRLVPEAGAALMKSLRPLGQVGPDLPRFTSDGIFEAERFELSTGKWVPCHSIAAVGAFRVTGGFTRQYLFRDGNDLASGSATRVTAQLAKHLAANSLGKPLLAYSPGTKELFVPLGGEIPGLYGRALTLLSGRPAVRIHGSPSLVYRSVGQREADLITTLLMN